MTRTQTTRLAAEELDARTMPAVNYFVLDFTPDYHRGSFADTFTNTKTASGHAPSFLDFNRDGWVNSTDVTIAAGKVAARVQSFFAPFVSNAANRLSIKYGDVLTNNNVGFEWIKYGMSTTAVQVSVMYFGGTSNQGSSVLGRAPLAGAGENIEGYGETYTRTIARSLLARGNATPSDFVAKVANVAAHELGHMMGLRHATSGDPSNIMNGVQSYSPGSARFVAGPQNTSNGYQQDAYKELDRSFQTTQKQVAAPTYSLGGQFLLDSDESSCGCGACSAGVARAARGDDPYTPVAVSVRRAERK